ncbi:pyridoxamine 5'-phosphate oxidase family protein [Agromyces sp. Soil535]|uniref:pyridoxamine 5'-phosphate oxidase family protein n=1 Tax=Agromyces sp. Soil535 TaxID=1736390 RepID=UPI0007007D2C|nr:pyridoxamine 5'-phosphate oxidase family protein [Agromyces sp. Soil535]KRE22898.1 hypothetical protein ASG80_08420 [Agromyces sp. Soil535]
MTESQTAAGLFDLEEPAHRMALEQLQSELIAWFTTVNSKGEPHAVPVWFLWHDGEVIVLSEPDAAKVSHVRHGSPVLLHLQGDRFGNQVVVLNGTAELSDRSATEWLDEIGDAYGTKYAEGMEESGVGLEPIAEKYSTVIVVTPTKLMAW